MRGVSLESPLKGHQPLYVFNFLFLILKQLQSSEPLAARSCLQLAGKKIHHSATRTKIELHFGGFFQCASQ
jgi:hypothetical protein